MKLLEAGYEEALNLLIHAVDGTEAESGNANNMDYVKFDIERLDQMQDGAPHLSSDRFSIRTCRR